MELRPAADYPEYGVSSDGRVWSYRTERWLRPVLTKKGYLVVNLSARGTRAQRRVHVLVAMAWLLPAERADQVEVAHSDGNSTNNSVGNLRWASRLENEQDKIAHATRPRGESHYNGRKTACPQGHEYSPDNIYWSGNRRTCKTCTLGRGE